MATQNAGIEEIQELFSSRSEQYTYAILKSALALNQEGKWKNCLSTIVFCNERFVKQGAAVADTLKYPGFEIYHIALSPHEGIDLIRGIVTDNSMKIGEREITFREINFDRLGFRSSVGRRVSAEEAWIASSWPGDQYLIHGRRELNPPAGPLLALDMPLYPNAQSAIEELLGLDASTGRTWDGGLVLFFPDYRAKIDKVMVGTESVSVSVECGLQDNGELLLKSYIKREGFNVIQSDVKLESLEKTFQFDSQLESVHIGLISMSNGAALDYWTYGQFRESTRTTLEEFTPRHIEHIISQGENVTTEFKTGFRDEKSKKWIAESAIAFANRSGGLILIGVDDHGEIIGVEGGESQESKDSIIQSLGDRCEPPINPNVSCVVLDSNTILL